MHFKKGYKIVIYCLLFFSNWDVNWSIIDRYTIYNYQRKSGGTGYDYKVDKSFEE